MREFCHRIGIAKRENVADMALLEFCVREDLNKIAPRVMAVLNPLKLVITNYDATKTEELTAENNPEDENGGTRIVPFSNTIWIEKDDFMENPPKKYFRLAVGAMVRLKNAYIIKCDEAVKNEAGEVVELRCSYVENSKSGQDESGIHVKGTIHWVSAAHALAAEIRVYDRLFRVEDPAAEADFLATLNPNSLHIIEKAYLEQSLKTAKNLDKFQFLRKGYFCVDKDSTPEKLVFNQTVGLKDSWKG
jgi:glutaminyl-tRNA synthetase